MRVLANAQDAYALSQTQVSLGGGRMVKLSDIATVKDSFGEIVAGQGRRQAGGALLDQPRARCLGRVGL
jgi:hypothetical protein